MDLSGISLEMSATKKEQVRSTPVLHFDKMSILQAHSHIYVHIRYTYLVYFKSAKLEQVILCSMYIAEIVWK